MTNTFNAPVTFMKYVPVYPRSARASPSEMNTLMGLRGLDFVLLGGDSAFFRSVVVMDSVSL